jgi:Flp pilus assembly protein TadB
MAIYQHPQHPIIRPPEEYEHVNSPVRDDTALGATEDLDRQPDGMPHQVIGLTALFSVMLAMLVAVMFVAGGTVSRTAAIVIALLAIPVLVTTLRRKAARDRDTLHPSR